MRLHSLAFSNSRTFVTADLIAAAAVSSHRLRLPSSAPGIPCRTSGQPAIAPSVLSGPYTARAKTAAASVSTPVQCVADPTCLE